VQKGQHNCWSHPVKIGAWRAVSARRIVVRAFFKEKINCERYLRVEGQRFEHFM
jgi:hypothetical protein